MPSARNRVWDYFTFICKSTAGCVSVCMCESSVNCTCVCMSDSGRLAGECENSASRCQCYQLSVNRQPAPASRSVSVIFVNENENENGEKRENNEFVNEN